MIFNILSVLNDDIFTGGEDNDRNCLKDILRYNKNHTWDEVGQMNEARHSHAVSELEDVSLIAGDCETVSSVRGMSDDDDELLALFDDF